MRTRLFKIIFHFKSHFKGSFKVVEALYFNILQMGRINLFFLRKALSKILAVIIKFSIKVEKKIFSKILHVTI